jgi:hypothetical protein
MLLELHPPSTDTKSFTRERIHVLQKEEEAQLRRLLRGREVEAGHIERVAREHERADAMAIIGYFSAEIENLGLVIECTGRDQPYEGVL